MPVSQHQPNRSFRWLFLPLFVLTLTALLALAFSGGRANAAQESAPISLELEPFVPEGELVAPTAIANAGDNRLFVVERAGLIRIVQADGAVVEEPFLDITDRVIVRTGTEEGLLGLAFHPDYAENGYFYVNYTAAPDGRTVISRFQVTADPNVADPNGEQIVLTVSQPGPLHNGGGLAFSPLDGYLYVAMGDGGGDNHQVRAPDPELLLGKILRLDVDGNGTPPDCDLDGNYTIPADNPLADGVGGEACDEIWALGLRNPWRITFDSETGDLYTGDVGQENWEEINFQPAASTGGENYGWPCYEGSHEYQTPLVICGPAGAYVMPIFEYENPGSGCAAATGGYVYRGMQYPGMVGHYFLTDFCSGRFWDLAYDGMAWHVTEHEELAGTFGFTTFGEAADGELYVANMATGEILHLAGGETPPPALEYSSYLPLSIKE